MHTCKICGKGYWFRHSHKLERPLEQSLVALIWWDETAKLNGFIGEKWKLIYIYNLVVDLNKNPPSSTMQLLRTVPYSPEEIELLLQKFKLQRGEIIDWTLGQNRPIEQIAPEELIFVPEDTLDVKKRIVDEI